MRYNINKQNFLPIMEQFNELSHCITYFHCFNKGTQYIIFPSEKCYPFGFFCDAVKKKELIVIKY